VIVLILLKKNSGDSWGPILETGNSKLGKEMKIQLVIKFQISSFLESYRENLFGNRTSKAPKKNFESYIIFHLNPLISPSRRPAFHYSIIPSI